MKYILELLGSSQPYPSRDNAIAALDDYLYHRPGQPIAAVYIDRDANRRALLAIGHDYGKGKASGTYRRYTIIGDADASTTVNNYNWASQIRLSRISYKRLLDEYGEIVTPPYRRFGYLGTEHDSWHTNPSSASDFDCVPNGATVQAAFEHILKGDYGSESDNFLRLYITANPTQISLPGSGEPGVQYTVTVSAEYSGNLTDATLTANYGQGGGDSFMPAISGPRTWSADYIIDSSFASVMGSLNSYAITYTATATVEGLEPVTATAVVTVVRPDIEPPEPTATYTVLYTPLAVSGNDVPEQKTGDWTTWTLRSTSPWEPPTGYYLDGWSTDSTGSEDHRVTSLTPNDFAGTTDNTIRVYPIWKLEDVEPKVLIITAPSQSRVYDATLHYYDHTRVKVSCNGQELPFTWAPDGMGWVGTGDGFTVAFAANEIPSQENVGADSNSVSITDYDATRYETGAGSSAQATISITRKPASITTKINGKSSETLYTGGAVPSDLSVVFSGFVGGQESAFGTISEHGVWVPTLNMSTAGSYELQFDYSSVSLDILNNYSITTHWATLTLEEEPLRVTFTTYGYTNADAVHYDPAHSTGFFQEPSNSVGLTGNLNDWWIWESNRTKKEPRSYVYATKPFTGITVKRWDNVNMRWIDPTDTINHFSVSVSGNTTTVTLVHYDEAEQSFDREQAVYAIKFN